MVEYECPECGNVLKGNKPIAPGKKIRCPECETTFVPASNAPKAQARKAKPKAEPVAPVSQPVVMDDDDEDDMTPYGVIRETEEEKRLADKNKPRFDVNVGKGGRSARGPAMALLVLPTNILIAQGSLTAIAGVITIIWGFFPIVFTDVPPSDEEMAGCIIMIFGGIVALGWGCLVCFGASQMQNLESYAWALVGSLMGVIPLLAGVFALVTLRDPRVVAGFEEIEGSVVDNEEEDEDDDDDDEDDD